MKSIKTSYFTRYMFKRWLPHIPDHEKRITLPTILTLTRIALVPFIIASMIYQAWGISLVLFIGAAITDIFDGKLARWRGEKTFLGACLDPIADKLLLVSCFFTLAFLQSSLFMIPRWFFWFIFVKEMALILGFMCIYAVKGYGNVQPQLLGKATGGIQMLFIAWVFICHVLRWVPFKTYDVMLGVICVLVVASFIHYAMIGLRWMRA